MNLGLVKILTREDALTWRLVDAIFSGGDAVALCRAFEFDLYSERAEAILENERRDLLLELLRDTDPRREAAVTA